MTIDEYFGDWMKVLDRTETMKIMGWLKMLDQPTLCPSIRNVFKAFKLCPYRECRIVFIGQDPYPQRGVAQGVLFGNSSQTPEDKLSPSLQVIKESVINFEIPHNLITFDPTLESWAKQGILMINSSLTTEVGKVGVHMMKWRPFMIAFLKQMSLINPGIIYVLFGSQAQILEPYIGKNNYILKIEHPAYFARLNKKMPNDIWYRINDLVYSLYGEKIEWYKEEKFY
jgi:uracil-DNA glycosylase